MTVEYFFWGVLIYCETGIPMFFIHLVNTSRQRVRVTFLSKTKWNQNLLRQLSKNQFFLRRRTLKINLLLLYLLFCECPITFFKLIYSQSFLLKIRIHLSEFNINWPKTKNFEYVKVTNCVLHLLLFHLYFTEVQFRGKSYCVGHMGYQKRNFRPIKTRKSLITIRRFNYMPDKDHGKNVL